MSTVGSRRWLIDELGQGRGCQRVHGSSDGARADLRADRAALRKLYDAGVLANELTGVMVSGAAKGKN